MGRSWVHQNQNWQQPVQDQQWTHKSDSRTSWGGGSLSCTNLIRSHTFQFSTCFLQQFQKLLFYQKLHLMIWPSFEVKCGFLSFSWDPLLESDRTFLTLHIQVCTNLESQFCF